jgi:hypothetical protein
MLETLLILILVLPQKMGRNWPLIPNMPHLFFSDIIPFLLLGPIAGIGLFPLYMWSRHMPCHIYAKREIQLPSCGPVVPLYHIYIWKRLGINLHGVLPQD